MKNELYSSCRFRQGGLSSVKITKHSTVFVHGDRLWQTSVWKKDYFASLKWIICVRIRRTSSENTSTDKHKARSFNVLYNFDWTQHNENALQFAKTMSELVDSYQPRTVWGQTSSSLLPLAAACGGRLEQFLFPEMYDRRTTLSSATFCVWNIYRRFECTEDESTKAWVCTSDPPSSRLSKIHLYVVAYRFISGMEKCLPFGEIHLITCEIVYVCTYSMTKTTEIGWRLIKCADLKLVEKVCGNGLPQSTYP